MREASPQPVQDRQGVDPFSPNRPIALDSSPEIPGEVPPVPFLQVCPPPVSTVDSPPAEGPTAKTLHRGVRVIEEGVIGGQLLASFNVTHGDEDSVATEPNVRLARMVDEEHY